MCSLVDPAPTVLKTKTEYNIRCVTILYRTVDEINVITSKKDS